MPYRSTLTFDFTGSDANQHTRLAVALREAGWVHVETSAFARDSDDITDLWEGIGIVARQAEKVGILSALNFQIQFALKDFSTNVSLSSTQSGPNALTEIKDRRFPGDA
jgi:hypothetical protein